VFKKGQIALYDLTGVTCYSNVEVRTTPDVPWERHLPPMPANTLTKWSILAFLRRARAKP